LFLQDKVKSGHFGALPVWEDFSLFFQIFSCIAVNGTFGQVNFEPENTLGLSGDYSGAITG